MSGKINIACQNNLGDVLRALDYLGTSDAATSRAVAEMLGFEWIEKKTEPTIELPPVTDKFTSAPRPSKIEPPKISHDRPGKPPMPDDLPDDAWVEPLSSGSPQLPDWYDGVKELSAKSGAATSEPPPIDPLFQPKWTRALLRNILAVTDNSGDIDIERTVERLARATPLLLFPKLRRKHLNTGIQVLIDLSETMRPYVEDQYAVLDDIKRLVAAEMLEEMVFTGCPSRGAGRTDEWPLPVYHPPQRGTTVLLLTNLGAGSSSVASERISPIEWANFADTVRKAGCAIVALVPYPTARISPLIRRAIAVIPWDRTTTTGLAHSIRSDADRRSR